MNEIINRLIVILTRPKSWMCQSEQLGEVPLFCFCSGIVYRTLPR
jgi:hypothetical protein